MYTAQGTLEKNAAIQKHGKMVRKVASQMMARLPANVNVDDLIQAGMIGLMDALSRFDAAQGVLFETFATQRVKGAMLDELRASDWLPRSVRKNQRSISQAIQRGEQKHHRAPTEAEIALELGISLASYQTMLANSRGAQLIYLDEHHEDEQGDNRRIEHQLVDEGQNPIEQLRDARMRTVLVEAIQKLPEREKLLMSMYYEQELNLKEIGAVMGITESRVCQLHSQAIGRLRIKLKAW